MLPESNVSVPFVVVMRTRSRVPDKETLPIPPPSVPAAIDRIMLDSTQAFEPNVAIVIIPV